MVKLAIHVLLRPMGRRFAISATKRTKVWFDSSNGFFLAWEQLEPGEQERLISEDVSVRRFIELGAISYV
jgi:hypothetical protein